MTTATAPSSNPKTTSAGKQPLSERQLGAMLSSDGENNAKEMAMLYGSVDSMGTAATADFWRSKDLAVLFASTDSIKLPPLPPLASAVAASKPFASIDAAVGLMSAPHPGAPGALPTSLMAQLMSKDSIFGSKDAVFASVDPLPFKSLDSAMSFGPVDTKTMDVPTTVSCVPGIYESREWLNLYENNHQELGAFTKDVFRTSERAGCPPPPTEVKRKSSKCWEMYREALKAQTVTPEMKPVPPPESPKSKPKPTSPSKAKKPRRGEPKEKIYVEPTQDDIISGRGGKSNSWPGNERYRAAIEEAKPAYRDGAKYEKTIMSQEIVELMMKEGRRFLKLEDSGPHQGEYYLMTKNQARKKAGQALREENTPESRKAKRDYYANRNKN